MQKKETGVELQKRGCNCAQATLMAMDDVSGLAPETACRVACGFGGGMRAGELCGAATGAVMAIGMALGNRTPEDKQTREKADAAVVEFNRRFKERFGTLICRELIGADSSTPEGKKELAEHPEKKAVCPTLVTEAERIARDILAER